MPTLRRACWTDAAQFARWVRDRLLPPLERRRRAAPHHLDRAARGRRVPQRPDVASGADDRDRRCDRNGPVLGAGGRLAQAGPAIVLSYAVCGLFAFFHPPRARRARPAPPHVGVVRVVRARVLREKAAFVSGWFYWINWATTTMVDITAAALYMNFFGKYVPWIGAVPAVGVGARRPRDGPRRQPRLGEGVRRAGVLVRAHQGRRPRGVPARRHLLRRLRHPHGRRPGSR